jgi:DNA-binding MurR/RpiR family transcriptional regulator
VQILDLIRSKMDTMTAKQRSIAAYILDSPEEASYLSLKEMSRRTNASEVSVLRFCSALGIDSFIELKDALRGYTQRAFKKAFKKTINPRFLMRAENRLSGTPSQMLSQVCADDRNNLDAMADSLDADTIFSCVQNVLKAEKVVIFAHDKSCLLAEYLCYRLNFLRIKASAVQIGDSDSLSTVLANLGDSDCMILFSFLPYHMPIRSIAEYGRHRGLPIITITDSSSSPAVVNDCTYFICPTGTRYFPNSHVSTMAFINIFASCIAISLGPVFDEILASEKKVSDFLDSSLPPEGSGSEKS